MAAENSKQHAYREQWKEPPELRESWWIRNKDNVFRSFIVIAVLSVLIGFPIAIVWDKKTSAQEKEEAQWKRIHQEKALCEPLFFAEKRLAAHNLWKVTCLDEEGNTSYKFIKTDQVMWNR